jgi:NAD(P)-dependent dehydrogenase (short-subunit alcohol dehydrogenase family)
MDPRKVALVTGAGQGIGKAIAQRLLRDGWAVVIAEVDEEAGRETVEEYQALGPARFHRTNVADEYQARAAVDAALGAFGRLDALVNCAGIAHTVPLTELLLADWNHVLGVNLSGPFLCAKHAAPHLRKTRGAIVNIASTRAFMSEPNTEAYAASKGGLVALTHALAASLGPEVRVNCVSPGWIDVSAWKKKRLARQAVLSEADHAQHPVGRVGRPGDVAACVAYLVSEEAGFITGANFMLDGGMTRKMIYV